jgi:hypothetical protein
MTRRSGQPDDEKKNILNQEDYNNNLEEYNVYDIQTLQELLQKLQELAPLIGNLGNIFQKGGQKLENFIDILQSAVNGNINIEKQKVFSPDTDNIFDYATGGIPLDIPDNIKTLTIVNYPDFQTRFMELLNQEIQNTMQGISGFARNLEGKAYLNIPFKELDDIVSQIHRDIYENLLGYLNKLREDINNALNDLGDEKIRDILVDRIRKGDTEFLQTKIVGSTTNIPAQIVNSLINDEIISIKGDLTGKEIINKDELKNLGIQGVDIENISEERLKGIFSFGEDFIGNLREIVREGLSNQIQNSLKKLFEELGIELSNIVSDVIKFGSSGQISVNELGEFEKNISNIKSSIGNLITNIIGQLNRYGLNIDLNSPEISQKLEEFPKELLEYIVEQSKQTESGLTIGDIYREILKYTTDFIKENFLKGNTLSLNIEKLPQTLGVDINKEITDYIGKRIEKELNELEKSGQAGSPEYKNLESLKGNLDKILPTIINKLGSSEIQIDLTKNLENLNNIYDQIIDNINKDIEGTFIEIDGQQVNIGETFKKLFLKSLIKNFWPEP